MRKLIDWFWITNLGVYLEDNKKKVVKSALVLLICFLLIAFILWIRYLVVIENFDLRNWPEWSLFERKLWEWMELLIIPAMLAILAILFNRAERKADREGLDKRVATDREISKDRQHDDALQAYFDMMMDLVVNNVIKGKQINEDIRAMARIRTLILLRQLDGTRKGYVLEFLSESKLIEVKNPIIDLNGADFSDMRLSEVDLGSVNLQETNFRRSLLNKVNLSNANFHEANIYDAMFFLCELINVDFSNAKMYGTSLLSNNLTGSNFSGTEFIGFDPLTRKLEDVDKFGNIEAKLRNNKLDNIHYDENTKWPKGFDPG